MTQIPVHIGQPVQVDLSGLETRDVAIGSGVSAVGEVVAVDETKRTITVHLGVSIEGRDRVAVSPERVVALDDAAVSSGTPVASPA